MRHYIAVDLDHPNLHIEHGIRQLEAYLAKWAAFRDSEKPEGDTTGTSEVHS